MFPSVIFGAFLCCLLISPIELTTKSSRNVVIQVRGDCRTLADPIAREHGFRYVREIFAGYCELEEDPASKRHVRLRRALEANTDPADMLLRHQQVQWAASQVPKSRQKREFEFSDPEWNNMWYLMRHMHTPSLPDLNITGAWHQGYTGRGRVVTFLDDGLEFDHPDLQENYDAEASTDINGEDNDPSPRYDPSNENKHGTRCAGEVSAKANNDVCGVGIAYHSRVGGVRMLDGDVTDSVEARSLSHRPDHVEIYSASWGPDDNGLVVDGPGPLAIKAFENGARSGRGGKGSIFVWASGNGGRLGDSCACDGYINSIYTVSVSSVTEAGNKPWFLEECPAVFTTAYSSGQGGTDHDIITTDLHHGCTKHHTGTSAAAPLAAAVYALVLEANPDLTWRDVMHITVLGSRSYAIPSNTNVIRNAAGFNVSSRYGFGLMDAGLMTWYASGWKNVPPMSTCESALATPNKSIEGQSSESFTLTMTECGESSTLNRSVNFIEQVQVFISMTTTSRGNMEIFLHSPSNTITQLLPVRMNDQSDQGFANWPFLTVQLWGEIPHGVWKLRVQSSGKGSAVLTSWKLVVHGTRDYPTSPRSPKETDRANCHVECDHDQACGRTDLSCSACRHYKQPLASDQFRCVGICPDGTYASESDKLCLPCHARCGSCRNASEHSCVSCKSNLYLVPDAMLCVDSCWDKYYTDRTLRKCVRCKADCASCESSSYVCTSCPSGFALKDTDCVKAPQPCDSSDYFDFTANQCRWCDARCQTCSGPAGHHCTSCDVSSKYPLLEYHTCVASCSPGFYRSNATSQCLPCYETCLTCNSSSETTCLSCKLGYVYLPESHQCEKYTGTPVYTDSKTGESHSCHTSCAQCSGPKPTDCTACNLVTEVLLDDGHCVHDCPDGFRISAGKKNGIETNVCAPCTLGCKHCTPENQCMRCDLTRGYQLIGDYCAPTCPEKSFLTGTHCEECQAPCSTCNNRTSCTECRGSLYLVNDQCVEKCPNGYYPKKRNCLPCHPICDTCTGPSEGECQTCADGFIFDRKQHKCSSTCANGNFYHKVEKRCQLCTNNCLECLSPGSYCQQCAYPMSLSADTHECLPCCQSNTTSDDCCQCPKIWNGYCLHPLASLPYGSSPWWLPIPLTRIQEKFNDLDHRHQTVVLVILFVTIISLSVCLLAVFIRNIRSLCLRSHDRSQYRDILYLSVADIDTDDEEREGYETKAGETASILKHNDQS